MKAIIINYNYLLISIKSHIIFDNKNIYDSKWFSFKKKGVRLIKNSPNKL